MSGKARRPSGQPQKVGELLPRLLDEIGLSPASQGMRLLKVWDAAVGPLLSPHCRPEGIRSGVLQATVRDSGWMQRVQLEKPRILARIKQLLDDAGVSDLRLRVGPLD